MNFVPFRYTLRNGTEQEYPELLSASSKLENEPKQHADILKTLYKDCFALQEWMVENKNMQNSLHYSFLSNVLKDI